MRGHPGRLPFSSNGNRHVAVNLSTGHEIACADAYIVAGTAALFEQWKFVLEMGPERMKAFATHPSFKNRLSHLQQ